MKLEFKSFQDMTMTNLLTIIINQSMVILLNLDTFVQVLEDSYVNNNRANLK